MENKMEFRFFSGRVKQFLSKISFIIMYTLKKRYEEML